MTQDQSQHQLDLWRLGSACLWVLFFLLGLQPENTFYGLRMLGGVVTARAMINNPYLIMWALSGYLVFFTYRACRSAGLSVDESRGKAMQLGLLGLLAFFPFRFEQALDYRNIILPVDRYINIGFALAKCGAWLYLLSTIGRYEITEGSSVFVRMPSFFPSARRTPEEEEKEEGHGEGHAETVPPPPPLKDERV